MTFPLNDCTPRTDYSFRNRTYAEHNVANLISPLEGLPIDMVTQIPLDVLHSVYLGVMKRLLKMWIHGEKFRGVFVLRPSLSAKNVSEISNILKLVSFTQPTEFQRRVRPLSDFGYYKGTEFKTFLLYTGPFCLKNILFLF